MPSDSLRLLKDAAIAQRPKAALTELLVKATQIFEPVINLALQNFMQELLKQAEQSQSNDQQNRCFESSRLIQRSMTSVFSRFALVLEHYFASISTGIQAAQFTRTNRGQPMHGGSDISLASLTLIESSDLEEVLALQEIANKVEIRYNQILFMLGQRFGVLAGTRAMEVDEIPIGPHRLCDCFKEASSLIALPVEHRIALYRQFDRALIVQIERLYDSASEICTMHKILPHLSFIRRRAEAIREQEKITTRRQHQDQEQKEHSDAQQMRSEQQNAANAALTDIAATLRNSITPEISKPPLKPSTTPSHVAANSTVNTHTDPSTLLGNQASSHAGIPLSDSQSNDESNDLDMFQTIRDLLAGRRHAMGQTASAAMQDSAHEVSTDELQSVLSALQAKPAPAMRIGGKTIMRNISHLKQDLMNHLRQFTPEGKQPQLNDVDHDAIDLVGMLFDNISKDIQATSIGQEFMARLQVPLLRIALEDKAFFTRRTHPARQLLNTVAEACANWLDEGTDDPGLIEKIRTTVDRVATEYDGDMNLFEESETVLARHLLALTKKSEVAERRHIDAAKGRERFDVARNTAMSAIHRKITDQSVHQLMRTLLEQAWSDVLTLTLLRQGEQSESYQHKLAVVDQLIKFQETSATSATTSIEHQQLKQEIESGLGQIGYHANDIETVVKTVLDAHKDTAISTQDDRINSETVSKLTEKLTAHSRLGGDAAIGVVKGASEDTQKVALDKAKQSIEMTPEEKRIYDQLHMLSFGTWFEFVLNQQGDKARRKLSWFSTLTGRCLFVNQRGVRAEDKTMDQLAREIARGIAVVLSTKNVGLIDRAWTAVLTSLKQFTIRDASVPDSTIH